MPYIWLFENQYICSFSICCGFSPCAAANPLQRIYILTMSCPVLRLLRDPGPAGGAAEMSGPADRHEGPAAAGPPGLLPEEV